MQWRRGDRVCGCFSRARLHGGAMSLNRCEQRIFEYWQGHATERQFWQEKVRGLAKETGDDFVAASKLDRELWRYYEERSGMVAVFREAVKHEGLQRTSMKNLAELVLRLWVEPRPKKKRAEGEVPPLPYA
jgi:hypothetical protein